MKHEEAVKELLVNNTISVIAKGGFEMATVRNLTRFAGDIPGVKMNDAYIYRFFGSKENLYAAAFVRLDSELFYNFCKAFKLVSDDTDESLTLKDRILKFLSMAWEYITHDEERCRCYVRYYYSIYFDRESIQRHNELYSGIITEIAKSFKNEADVAAIIHSVFTTMFDFAIRVFNGQLVNDDTNKPHVLNVLYCMMSTYLKDVPDSLGVKE